MKFYCPLWLRFSSDDHDTRYSRCKKTIANPLFQTTISIQGLSNSISNPDLGPTPESVAVILSLKGTGAQPCLTKLPSFKKNFLNSKYRKIHKNYFSEDYLLNNFSSERTFQFQKFEHLPVWMKEIPEILQKTVLKTFKWTGEDKLFARRLARHGSIFFRHKKPCTSPISTSEYSLSPIKFFFQSPIHSSSSQTYSSSNVSSFSQISSSSQQLVYPPAPFGLDELLRRGGGQSSRGEDIQWCPRLRYFGRHKILCFL